jgi:uncharacterized protein
VSADENITTIQGIYEAFGRGDVDFILGRVTDDVDWATDTVSTAAPWYGTHHGKAGVGDFFQALVSTMTVEKFEPTSFTANDDEVHTMVAYTTTRIANGKTAEMNLHHFFRFRDGKIAYVRSAEDTCQIEAIFRD